MEQFDIWLSIYTASLNGLRSIRGGDTSHSEQFKTIASNDANIGLEEFCRSWPQHKAFINEP